MQSELEAFIDLLDKVVYFFIFFLTDERRRVGGKSYDVMLVVLAINVLFVPIHTQARNL